MELYRLLRLTGGSVIGASLWTLFAYLTQSQAEARHATMEHLLGATPEEE